MSDYETVLFATDLSDVNRNMRLKVQTLVDIFEAKLHVVHVVTNLSALSRSQTHSVGLKDELIDSAKESLAVFCKPLSIPDEQQIIKVGQPAKEVIETIKELKCQLLLLGRYGEGGILHLLGSVSHRLLSHAPCELMLIN